MMKLTLNITPANKTHESSVVQIAYNAAGTNFISVSDNGQILKWNTQGQYQEQIKLTASTSSIVTPGTILSVSKASQAGFIFGDVHGKLFFTSETGRIDRVVEAHEAHVTVIEWNPDHSSFLTASEDGTLKVWSSSGMLRSVLVQSGFPISCASWSPDGSSVVYTNGKNLVIKSIAATGKTNQWKAHDGVITQVSWSKDHGLLVSGGEDNRYKVWDNHGRLLFASRAYNASITTVSWTPGSGDSFIVGASDKLILCDQAGWTYGSVDVKGGSVYQLSWKEDTNQFIVGQAGGTVLMGQLFGKSLEKEEWTFVQKNSTQIGYQHVDQLNEDILEFKDDIVDFEFGYGYFVVVTCSQAYIHQKSHMNTPHISPLPSQFKVKKLLISSSYFALIDKQMQVQVLNFDGKVVSSFKLNSSSQAPCTKGTITLSPDFLIYLDPSSLSTILMIDVSNGKQLSSSKWTHHCEVKHVYAYNNKVSRFASMDVMAFVDQQNDLWLLHVSRQKCKKLASMVGSVCWNEKFPSLACVSEGEIIVWYYPATVFLDMDLLNSGTHNTENMNLGKNATIVYFSSAQCCVKKYNGGFVQVSGLSTFIPLLHGCFERKQWEQAIRLCRYAKNKQAWACLAAMAIQAEDLNTAEVAYAALEKAAQVQNICKIKELPNAEWGKAELALFKGHVQEAESIFLSRNMVYRALFMRVELFQWDKALDLALKYGQYLDILQYYRSQYLQAVEMKETHPRYVELAMKIQYDADIVQQKIQSEEMRS